MNPGVVYVWRDLGFTLVWGHDWTGPRGEVVTSCDTWMNWSLYAHGGFEVRPTGDEDTWPILYERLGAPATPDLAKAEPHTAGFIKFDGCLQWHQTEHFHIDEREEIDRFAEALHRIRDLMVAQSLEEEPRPNAWRPPN